MSIERNSTTFLKLRPNEDGLKTYDLFLLDKQGSEFEQEFSHEYKPTILRVVQRVEWPRRVQRPQRGRIPYEFFEDMNGDPVGFRGEGKYGLVALPGRDENTGLRLFAFLLDNDTVVWLSFLDKQGFEGKWQDHPDSEYRGCVSRYQDIASRIQEQLDLGVLELCDDGGLRHFEEECPQEIIDLSDYL
jgi:hypothetical protein